MRPREMYRVGVVMLFGAVMALGGCAGVGAAKKDLRSAVDAKRDSLNECYSGALERDATAAGTVSMHIIVGEKSRRVESVEFIDAGFADPELQTCISTTLVGEEIAAKPSANVKVEYRLEFEPAS